MSNTRVLIVGEHPLIRAGLRWLLEGVDDIAVETEADSEAQALQAVENHDPGLVLIDVAVVHANWQMFIHRLRKEHPSLQLVVLAEPAEAHHLRDILYSGATALIPRDVEGAELRTALEVVRRGEAYLSPLFSTTVTSGPHRRKESESGPLSQLTPRQREVLRLLAEGRGTREIASALQIGPRTVATHRNRIMNRLNIHDLVGLVHFAFRVGLVVPHS